MFWTVRCFSRSSSASLRLGVLASVLCAANAAVAQDAEVALDTEQSEEQGIGDAEAQARFTAGEIAFSSGRFEDALSDFQRAYELSERPELLYNIGLAAYRLRNDVLAREYFERFVAALPNHPNVAQAEERLQTIREQDADEDDEDEDEDNDVNQDIPPLTTQQSDPSRVGPWALGLGGGAALIGGGVLLALALADKSDIEGMGGRVAWPQIEDQFRSVPRRSGAGIALLAVGGAAVLGALVWRVMTPNPDIRVAFGVDRVRIEGSF